MNNTIITFRTGENQDLHGSWHNLYTKYYMITDEFKKYLLEIQRFDCKTVDPFKDPWASGNFVFGYFENTDQLQKSALASLPALSKKKIEQNLKKLNEVQTHFLNFDRTYTNLILKSKTDLLTVAHLKKQMTPFELTGCDIKLADEFFLIALYDIFRYRIHSLVNLISKTEDFMTEINFIDHHPLKKKNSLQQTS